MYEMSKHLSIEEKADASNIPKLRSFYYWNNKSRTEKFGDMGGPAMFKAISELKTDAEINFQEKSYEKEMVITVITPFIKRVLSSVPQTSEIIFMDTTSHVDLMNTSVTLIMTWSAVGGLPVGLILSDSQTEEAYAQGKIEQKYY